MDVDAIVDRLYGLPLEEFTAARDAAARAAPDAESRKTIKALRKPTAAAHVVNLLIRDRGAQIDDLLALGEDLRAAMGGEATEVRRLTEQRRAIVGELVDPDLPPGVQQDVTATLEAATADPQLAAGVRSGRLVKPLRYAGFGLPDLADAVALAPDPPPSAAPGEESAVDARELAAARKHVLELAGRADDAQRRYERAAQRADEARQLLGQAEAECADAYDSARAAHAEAEAARAALGELERRDEGR